VTPIPVGPLTLVPIVLPQDSLPLFIQSQVNLSLGPNINNPVLRPQAIRFALDQLAPNLYTDLPYLTFDNTETIYSSLEQRMEELRFESTLLMRYNATSWARPPTAIRMLGMLTPAADSVI
jgi:hypothetical protein